MISYHYIPKNKKNNIRPNYVGYFINLKNKKMIKKDSQNATKEIESMKKAGVYFGHRASKLHPKMQQYILGVKGGDHIHIIDPQKSAQKLAQALDFIKKSVLENKNILFVGTGPGIGPLIEEVGKETGYPYVNQRWIGGIITNFAVIKKRIEYFKELERKRDSGELAKYTKKEQGQFDKEIEDLRKNFEGIKKMEKIPDIIFIANMEKDYLAVKEAKKNKITIVALADTNVNPELADYPIPANDEAISSVKYILDKVKETIKSVKK